MDKFDLKKYLAESKLLKEEETYDIYGDGDVVIDISRATPEQERLIRWESDPENGITEFENSEDAQKFADEIMNLNSAKEVKNYYDNVRGWATVDYLSTSNALNAFVGNKQLEEYGGAEFDEETSKRNFFAASYNTTERSRFFTATQKFLSKLKASGKTNMLGAVPYLQAEFNIEKKEAKDLLAYWMGSYRNMDEAKEIPTSPGEMEMGDDGKMYNVKASNSERKMALRSVIDILKDELDVNQDDAFDYIRTHREDLFDGTVDAFSKEEVVNDYNEYVSVNFDIN